MQYLFLYHSKSLFIVSFIFFSFLVLPFIFNLSLYVLKKFIVKYDVYLSEDRLCYLSTPHKEIHDFFFQRTPQDSLFVYFVNSLELFQKEYNQKAFLKYINFYLLYYLFSKNRYYLEYILFICTIFLLLMVSGYMFCYDIFFKIDALGYLSALAVLFANVYMFFKSFSIFLNPKSFLASLIKGYGLHYDLDSLLYFYEYKDATVISLDVDFEDGIKFEFALFSSLSVAFVLSYIYFLYGVLFHE